MSEPAFVRADYSDFYETNTFSSLVLARNVQFDTVLAAEVPKKWNDIQMFLTQHQKGQDVSRVMLVFNAEKQVQGAFLPPYAVEHDRLKTPAQQVGGFINQYMRFKTFQPSVIHDSKKRPKAVWANETAIMRVNGVNAYVARIQGNENPDAASNGGTSSSEQDEEPTTEDIRAENLRRIAAAAQKTQGASGSAPPPKPPVPSANNSAAGQPPVQNGADRGEGSTATVVAASDEETVLKPPPLIETLETLETAHPLTSTEINQRLKKDKIDVYTRLGKAIPVECNGHETGILVPYEAVQDYLPSVKYVSMSNFKQQLSAYRAYGSPVAFPKQAPQLVYLSKAFIDQYKAQNPGVRVPVSGENTEGVIVVNDEPENNGEAGAADNTGPDNEQDPPPNQPPSRPTMAQEVLDDTANIAADILFLSARDKKVLTQFTVYGSGAEYTQVSVKKLKLLLAEAFKQGATTGVEIVAEEAEADSKDHPSDPGQSQTGPESGVS